MNGNMRGYFQATIDCVEDAYEDAVEDPYEDGDAEPPAEEKTTTADAIETADAMVDMATTTSILRAGLCAAKEARKRLRAAAKEAQAKDNLEAKRGVMLAKVSALREEQEKPAAASSVSICIARIP